VEHSWEGGAMKVFARFFSNLATNGTILAWILPARKIQQKEFGEFTSIEKYKKIHTGWKSLANSFYKLQVLRLQVCRQDRL